MQDLAGGLVERRARAERVLGVAGAGIERTFGIGEGESVRFVQPSASSITLNRVTGGDRSGIFGNLNANGQVWLINPNGILFGQNARINVGGLLGTTRDIAG